MKIQLEFECTAPDGKCGWNQPESCIDPDTYGETDEPDNWVCPYLKATRKLKQ